jgi:hypothetical protein
MNFTSLFVCPRRGGDRSAPFVSFSAASVLHEAKALLWNLVIFLGSDAPYPHPGALI